MRQLFFLLGGFPVIWNRPTFFQFFCQKSWKKCWILRQFQLFVQLFCQKCWKKSCIWCGPSKPTCRPSFRGWKVEHWVEQYLQYWFPGRVYVPTSTLWRIHQTEKTALIPNVTHKKNIILIWCFLRKKAIIPLLLNRWFSLVGFGFFREKLWGISPWRRRFGASCSHVSLLWRWFSLWAPT